MVKQFISALAEIFELIPQIKQNSKGKFNLGSVTAILAAINGVGLVVASHEDFIIEFAGYGFAQRAEVYQQFKNEFDIENDKLEALFEGLLAALLQGFASIYTFVKD